MKAVLFYRKTLIAKINNPRLIESTTKATTNDNKKVINSLLARGGKKKVISHVNKL